MPEEPHDALVQRAEAQLGRVLKEKYRLDALLGVGGMAAVFAATHRNGNRVALKLLHPELLLNKEALTRFLREGYAANKVEHRGTVRVLDDDHGGGEAFLVMELLVGETVEALWESAGRALDVKKVLALADQTLDVLAAAHDKGIVHRDIKPENLFVTEEGVLKVLDFGIARVRESTTSATVTKTGSPFGSPAFMAPEQALGRSREVDARVDVYAVGATMFTLLTGEFVHEAESAHEMVIVAATTAARSLSAVHAALPQEVVALVDRALAFDRNERWPDARAMRRAVRETHALLFGGDDAHRSAVVPMTQPIEPPGARIPRDAVSGTGPTAVGPAPKSAAQGPPVSLAATRVKAIGQPPSGAARTAPPTSTKAPAPSSRASERRSTLRRWPLALASAAVLVATVGVAVGLGASRGRAIDPIASAVPSTGAPAVDPATPTGEAPQAAQVPASALIVPPASPAPMASASVSSHEPDASAPAPPPKPAVAPTRSAAGTSKPRPAQPAAPPSPSAKPDPFGAR